MGIFNVRINTLGKNEKKKKIRSNKLNKLDTGKPAGKLASQ